MKGYIGLDIGGTKILGSFYDLEGNSIKRAKKKTKAIEGVEVVIGQIYKVVDEILNEEDFEVLGIGAGCPGLIKDESEIVFTPNIPFENFDLRSPIQEKYNVPFVLGNDVNVAMYGEWKASDMKGAKNVLGIFAGTGLGGAIIIDGKLYLGKGGAAEIGHVNVNPEGALCGCGSHGCLEAYTSKSGIQRTIEGQLRKGRESVLKEYLEKDGAVIKSSSLKNAYESGDDLAVEVINRAADYLGVATGSFINIFHPDLIIYGGGIMESLGEDILPIIEKAAMRQSLTGMQGDVAFRLSHLSDDAGIFGAYSIIKDHIEAE